MVTDVRQSTPQGGTGAHRRFSYGDVFTFTRGHYTWGGLPFHCLSLAPLSDRLYAVARVPIRELDAPSDAAAQTLVRAEHALHRLLVPCDQNEGVEVLALETGFCFVVCLL